MSERLSILWHELLVNELKKKVYGFTLPCKVSADMCKPLLLDLLQSQACPPLQCPRYGTSPMGMALCDNVPNSQSVWTCCEHLGPIFELIPISHARPILCTNRTLTMVQESNPSSSLTIVSDPLCRGP